MESKCQQIIDSSDEHHSQVEDGKVPDLVWALLVVDILFVLICLEQLVMGFMFRAKGLTPKLEGFRRLNLGIAAIKCMFTASWAVDPDSANWVYVFRDVLSRLVVVSISIGCCWGACHIIGGYFHSLLGRTPTTYLRSLKGICTLIVLSALSLPVAGFALNQVHFMYMDVLIRELLSVAGIAIAMYAFVVIYCNARRSLSSLRETMAVDSSSNRSCSGIYSASKGEGTHSSVTNTFIWLIALMVLALILNLVAMPFDIVKTVDRWDCPYFDFEYRKEPYITLLQMLLSWPLYYAYMTVLIRYSWLSCPDLPGEEGQFVTHKSLRRARIREYSRSRERRQNLSRERERADSQSWIGSPNGRERRNTLTESWIASTTMTATDPTATSKEAGGSRVTASSGSPYNDEGRPINSRGALDSLAPVNEESPEAEPLSRTESPLLPRESPLLLREESEPRSRTGMESILDRSRTGMESIMLSIQVDTENVQVEMETSKTPPTPSNPHEI